MEPVIFPMTVHHTYEGATRIPVDCRLCNIPKQIDSTAGFRRDAAARRYLNVAEREAWRMLYLEDAVNDLHKLDDVVGTV